MKEFEVPIGTGANRQQYKIYVGEPSVLRHPLHYQDLWWRQEYDVVLPDDVMESFETLYGIAYENNVNFEDLAAYALGENKNIQTRREGNVLYADFSSSTKAIDAAESIGMLSSDTTLPDVLFFDCFRLEGEKINTVASDIAYDIMPIGDDHHAHRLAELVLTTVLFSLAVSGDHSKRTWIDRLDGFFGEHAAYNLAVIADVLGYQLAVSDLGVIEFFLCCSPEAQAEVCTLIRNAIRHWSEASVSGKTLALFKKHGLEKKDAVALKKTLKTARHSL